MFFYSKKDVYVFFNMKVGIKDEYVDFVVGIVDIWLNNIDGEKIWFVGGVKLV